MDNNSGISPEIYQEIAREVNYSKRWIAITEANLMRKKLSLAYDKLVDLFYKYKTTAYRRHGINKVGTRTGKNLYRALQSGSYKYNRPFLEKYVIDGGIEFNADKMQSYRYKDPKEYVFEGVLKGYRFRHTFNDSGNNPSISFVMTYQLTYSDPDCGGSFKGSILKILNELRDALSEKYHLEAKELAKRSLKLKYTEII